MPTITQDIYTGTLDINQRKIIDDATRRALKVDMAALPATTSMPPRYQYQIKQFATQKLTDEAVNITPLQEE